LPTGFDRVPTILLLDDADQAAPETLAAVTRILHLDAAPDSRLTVVLAANRTRGGKLGGRLLDLAELRIELDRWDEPDTQAYLTTALERAGRSEPLFDERAAARLHELSRGVPRQVCQLAELALLAGAGQRLVRIDEATIDAVYEELAVSPAAVQELAFAAE
jgi:general secretion pathway protein A